MSSEEVLFKPIDRGRLQNCYFEWDCVKCITSTIEYHLLLPLKTYKYHQKNYFNLPSDWNHLFIPEICHNVVYFYNDKNDWNCHV